MDEKLEILQCLIANRAFAPSQSALAKDLGYKGKMGMYRLAAGAVRPETVEKTWRLVMERYHVTEEFLYGLARSFSGASLFYGALVGEMNRKHPRWVENLVLSLVADCYEHCSPRFKADTAPLLIDLKADEPGVYWGIVALVYIRAKGIDVYRHKEGAPGAGVQVIDELDRLLYDAYPEKLGAHESACNLKALMGDSPGLWNVVWNCILLFMHYADSGFRAEAEKATTLLGLGTRSYWLEPGRRYGPGADVWLLVEQSHGRQTGGSYQAMRLTAGADIRSFGLADAMMLQFWAADGGEPPLLQASKGRGLGRQWGFYHYCHDVEKRELRLEPCRDEGNLLGLPATLRMIDLRKPSGADEKVWARLMADWDRNSGEAAFRQARELLSGITDMSCSYRITDVSLSKAALTITIEHGGEARRYRLPADSYDFLSEINPSQRVIIARHADGGDALFADWPGLGYSVALAEFTEG